MNRAPIFLVSRPDMIAAGLPSHLLDVKLVLDCGVVEVESDARVVRTAGRVLAGLVVHLRVESAVPETAVGLALDSADVADADRVVRVYSFCLLNVYNCT